MKRILCLSECCLDVVFAGLPGLPAGGEEVWCSDFAFRAGGGANTAIMLAGQGVPVRFLTAYAADLSGSLIEKVLLSAGITPVLPEKRPLQTAVSAVLGTEKDRSFASFAGDGARFDRTQILRELGQADILHSFFGYAADLDLFTLCQESGTLLSLDFSWNDAERRGDISLLSACDLVKMNEDEARRFTGCSSAEDALILLASLVRKAAVITLGEGGSIGMRHGEEKILRQPALKPKVFRDSCGAGDAFAAGLLTALALNESLENGLSRGAALAAYALSLTGGNGA